MRVEPGTVNGSWEATTIGNPKTWRLWAMLRFAVVVLVRLAASQVARVTTTV